MRKLKNIIKKLINKIIWIYGGMQTIESSPGSNEEFNEVFLKNKEDKIEKLQKLRQIYPKVLIKEDTIDYVLKNNCSIVRLGDGEMELAIKNTSPNRENYYFDKLAEKIRVIMKTGTTKHSLVCINCIPNEDSYGFSYMSYYYLTKFHYKKINQFFNCNSFYGDALSFRIVSENQVEQFKKLWNGKKILFVISKNGQFEEPEGLFDNAIEKAYIYGPNEGAFVEYDRIMSDCLKYDKDWIVYLALGVTATALAWELAEKGYRALDLGKLDVSYSLFKKGIDSTKGIPPK